jgi:hypothetical protein
MADIRPIPGQTEAANVQESPVDMAARSKLSNILAPYQEKLGVRPISPVKPDKTVGEGISPSVQDQLYKAVHPDTFNKVMDTVMAMVTGKYTPNVDLSGSGKPDVNVSWEIPFKQLGGGVGGGSPYVVGEQGPELFVPSTPGQIIPNPLTQSRMKSDYRNIPQTRMDTGRARPRYGDMSTFGGGGFRGPEAGFSADVNAMYKRNLIGEPGGPFTAGAEQRYKEAGLEFPTSRQEGTPPGTVDTPQGPRPDPLHRILPERLEIPIPFMPGISSGIGLTKREKPLDLWPAGAGGGGETPLELKKNAQNVYELPSPEFAVSHERRTPSVTPGPDEWKQYDEGIRYKVGPRDVAGDKAARERIARESQGLRIIPGQGPGPGGSYLGSYYDVHPEERAMEAMRAYTQPTMDAYQKALDRATNIASGYGMAGVGDRKAREEMRAEAIRSIPTLQAEMGRLAAYGPEAYKAGMEYGPLSPRGQKELAEAEYYREMPGVRKEIAEQTGEARKRPFFSPGGTHYWDPSKNEMVALDEPVSTGQRNMLDIMLKSARKKDPMTMEETFDEGMFRTMGRAMVQAGALPKQMADVFKEPKKELPDFETFSKRAKAQGSKLSRKQLEDAYKKLQEAA